MGLNLELIHILPIVCRKSLSAIFGAIYKSICVSSTSIVSITCHDVSESNYFEIGGQTVGTRGQTGKKCSLGAVVSPSCVYFNAL